MLRMGWRRYQRSFLLPLLLLHTLLARGVRGFSIHTTLPSRTILIPSIRPTIPSTWKCSTRKSHGYYTLPTTATTTSTNALKGTSESEDPLFDGRTTLTLVGGQSLLIAGAIVAATILHTPNFGFGPGITFDGNVLEQGTIYAIPLFLLAYLLDLVEDRFPSLQDVSKATQRSVIALLGGTFKPGLALLTSVALGLAAGFGEEMLFRGVLQYELAERFGSFFAVVISSLIFGALHAVTPLYALLATLGGAFFGYLYESSDNLAVPIVTHAVYDVGALLWAHWTVTQMTASEREEIVNWEGPQDRN